jgi:Phage MuF-C-terminal domain
LSESWVRAVNAVIRGESSRYRFVRLGPLPEQFRSFGLLPADIVMSAAKIARVRREHPEVPLRVLLALPELVSEPMAIVPSIRRDGSVVAVLVVNDRDGEPVIAILTADAVAQRNVILSVYGKSAGKAWIKAQIAYARREGLNVFERSDFAATVPKPGSASGDTVPSSPGPIPVDGAAKPRRNMLRLRPKSTET